MIDYNEIEPDWVSAPGETMRDILAERKLSNNEFARMMGRTPAHANELLHGRATITTKCAQRLARILGASTAFWINRETHYREDLARLQREVQHAAEQEWIRELPVKDMIKFGWIEPVQAAAEKVAVCLQFFGVSDVGAWRNTCHDLLERAAFRASPSFDCQPGALFAWLRQGEIESASIDCAQWDSKRFQELLSTLRSLTRKKDPNYFIPELNKRCAECGVAVVVVRAPKGCRASGSTRFVSPSKALIMLSFRYLSDDQFWFSFFHEAGHLLLHGKNSIFLEGANMVSTKQQEEANEFAADVLIPPEFRAALLTLPYNHREVIKFARFAGVSPGVVVGQLQHLRQIKRNQMNSLKRRYRWTNR